MCALTQPSESGTLATVSVPVLLVAWYLHRRKRARCTTYHHYCLSGSPDAYELPLDRWPPFWCCPPSTRQHLPVFRLLSFFRYCSVRVGRALKLSLSLISASVVVSSPAFGAITESERTRFAPVRGTGCGLATAPANGVRLQT